MTTIVLGSSGKLQEAPSARTSRTSSLQTLPDDILCNLFEHCSERIHPSDEPPLDQKALGVSRLVGDNPWLTDIHTKKALVRVCKTWRALATPLLYRQIFFHQPYQVDKLARCLEASSKRTGSSAGYGRLVLHIHAHFEWKSTVWDLRVEEIGRLLNLCTSIKSLCFKVGFRRLLDEDHDPNPCSMVNFLIRSPYPLQPAFNSLSKLTLMLDRPVVEPNPLTGNMNSQLTFGNLQDLTCEAENVSQLHGLTYIAQSFILPTLRRFSIQLLSTLPQGGISDTVADLFIGVLKEHGQNLSALELDTRLIDVKAAKNIGDILRLTPNLRTLRCSVVFFHPIYTSNPLSPFNYLERLELLTPNNCIPPICTFRPREWCRFDLDQFFGMASDRSIRKTLPSLETVAIYDRYLPLVPILKDVPPYYHEECLSYLRGWANTLLSEGITLVGASEDEHQPDCPF